LKRKFNPKYMTILVFSDTHLTGRFNKKKFIFLTRIINKADKVIINGDFWDGHLTTFNHFITSQWSNLFKLLKQKKAVYIYGNHDRKEYSDSRVSSFSTIQTTAYSLTFNNRHYYFEHGHSFLPSIDNKLRITSYHLVKIITLLANCLEFPIQTLKIWFGGIVANNSIKKKRNGKTKNGFIVCGHTHYPEIDKKNQFLNTGFIKFGLASYLLINNNGIQLKKESYL